MKRSYTTNLTALPESSRTTKTSQLNVFLYESCFGHGVFTAMETLTKTEVGTRDCGIAVIGMSMLLVGGM